MALRVLLADESSTIKKVFQLALQDFAVEVRPVNVGVDVLAVARSFKPDIVFADVLLQKKNGYEVAMDLKQDGSLAQTPVVLMWSGFMELDEDKFQACKADAQLEKPFDVAALRKLVTDLVPRTQNQRISQFLSFPKMPEMEEPAKAPPTPPPAPKEDFQQVSIPKMKGGGASADRYRLNLKPEELEPGHIPVEYDLPSEKVSMEDVLSADDGEAEAFAIRETRRAPPPKPSAPPPAVEANDDEVMLDELGNDEVTPVKGIRASGIEAPNITEKDVERIVREQAAQIIESVVWKIVPELAERIIERELDKLLKERESHP